MCFKFLKKIYMISLISGNIGYFLAGFRWCQLFVVILDGFRSFQVVPRFSKYIDVLIKKCSLAGAYLKIPWVEEDWQNNVTTAMLKSLVRKEQIMQNIYL